MINNSPRSATAASYATSNTNTAPLRLTELHRFTDPAEAAASLVLREGKPEALDFYLDHGPFMSATSPPQRRMPSRLGLPTKRPGSTRS
jgi:hypothetical protein